MTTITHTLNHTDVPTVTAAEMYEPMRRLIARGRGLALLNGLAEDDIRELERDMWDSFKGSNEARVAVALRFRALLGVFASRRLKELHLNQGLKLVSKAIAVAANHRLNMNYGFAAQKFVLALDTPPACVIPIRVPSRETAPVALAA